MNIAELYEEPVKPTKVEAPAKETLTIGGSWHCPRCRCWVKEEVRKVCEHCRKVEKELEAASEVDGFEDEVLPENVFKAYIAGEICYMTCTEDGRVVRLDEWAMPGMMD